MSLDIGKLKNVVRRDDGSIIAQCPACDAEGGDRTHMNHLIVYPSGSFGCAIYPGEEGYPSEERKKHLREIFRLAGGPGSDDLGGVGDRKRYLGPKYVGPKFMKRGR